MKTTKFNETEDYTHMTVLGADGVFSPNRIQRSSLPDGFYHYELSSGKDRRFGAISTGRTALYAGDFISKTPLDISEKEVKPLTDQDWSMHSDKPYDFEDFWGYKLSIDKQISNANHKRDIAMGKDPNARDAQEIIPVTQEPTMMM